MLESSLSRRGDRRRRRAIPALLGRFLEDRPRTEVLWLVGIVALSTVLRIAWVVYAARKPVGLHDPGLYLLYGEQIAKGNGYSLLNGEPTAYYPAGYPAALGAVLWAVRQTPLPYDPPIIACLFNVVLGAGTVVLVYALGRRLFGARVGLIAAGLVAAFPNLVFHSAAYLSETLFNFLALAALAVLLLGPRDPCQASLRRFAAFGLVLGLATLVRPISLLFLPAVAIGCLIAGAGWRRAVVPLVPALAVTAAVIAPLTVRNLIVMDAPVVISTNLGDDLCIGRNPDAKGTYVESPYCGFGGRYAHVPRPEFETVRNDDNIRRALEYLVDHPARELHLLALRAFHLVRHDHDGLSAVESYGDDEFMHPRVRAWLGRLADGFFFATLALALFGLPALARGRDARRLIALLALVALATVPLAFFGDPRFHVPAVPLLSIAAAVSAATLLARWRARGGGDRAGARLAGGR